VNEAISWPDVVIPVAVFVAALIATLWLRRVSYKALTRWAERTEWQGDDILLQATRGASVLWCIMISAALGLAVSPLTSRWKSLSSDGLWTLLVLSLALTAFNLADQLIPMYGEKLQFSQRTIKLTGTIAKALIIVIGILLVLEIWGVPTSPILLVVALVVLIAALAFRETLPNLLAGFQLNTTEQVKIGDYIKLDTGEEGYVRAIDWRMTQIEGLDQSTIFVPNRKLIQTTVINYGKPIKKAKEAFQFYDRLHLKELTGLKAKNLRELTDILKNAPDSIVYYHTHHFLEEHHYLTPEPANDFALWVSDVLGDVVLGERLASVDAFEFPNLGALRERLVNVMEECLSQEPQSRQAPEGREFYFIKSVSVILPTPYIAHDLREFLESLRNLSLGSLYFHIFESRLRLQRATNDFSVWLEQSLDEPELADEIARFDPYTFTLEGTKSRLIYLIEKRLK
jgi:small-conductance mechanosensitive channel